jgi:autotransporter-associated beta strand protein
MKTKLILAAALGFTALPLQAEFLFNQYLEPSFFGAPNTEYSQWNVMFAPNGGENYPDAAAPNGTYQTASAAGFSNPGDWSPTNPLAFWHVDNPTLTQTNGGHFIIGPGTAGNIYSFAVPSFYEVADTTPFTLGTVVFQFQSEGTAVDFSTIKLQYDNGMGIVELAPTEFIREYRAGTSSFGGFSNRNAVQWDLTSLGITEYQITFNSLGSSMSFQQALLDTSATFAAVVPGGRTWEGTGAQNWSAGTNWAEGTTSVANGNVRFENTANSTITLDGDRTVAEFTIATASDTTLVGTSKLTANTGITATAAATGTTTIETAYELGAYNLMSINAGEVRLEGTVSGAYGMLKTGAGKLVLGANNTFGTSTAGLGVQGGTLRIKGTNSYGGSTSVLWGTLEVAADAPVSANGAFGNASTAVLVGASSNVFSSVPEAAQIVIDGNHTVARNISIELGTFEKRLGAKDTTTEAVYSGNVSLLGTTSTASNLKLFAQNSADTVRFSGNISGGGSSKTLSINANGEQGTVIFSGANKTYASQTIVSGGTLIIDAGSSTTGNGAWTVSSGATLRVDGTVGGSGALTLASGGTVTGSGTINKAFTIGAGSTLSPGNSPGTLNTGSQTWAGGGTYLWEINDVNAGIGTDPGWDWVNISGSLSITATDLNPFSIDITSLTLANTAGLIHNFADLTSYSWTLATASGGISGFSMDAFILNTSAFQNSFTGSFGLAVSGNDLVLSYTAVPEPSTALLILLACAGFILLRRRKSLALA